MKNPSKAFEQFLIRSFDRSMYSMGQIIDELLQEVRQLRQENQCYREALEKINSMHRLTHSDADAIDVAKKAPEGEQ